MNQVHGCPAAIARRLAEAVTAAAEDKLVGVYLHGSAVLGGWVPGRSDVDVLLVAADDTDVATADAMARAIADMPASTTSEPAGSGPDCPVPALEASIVTATAAGTPAPPWLFLRHVVTGPTNVARVVRPGAGPAAAAGDRDLLMHYAVCRAAGHAASGPPPRTVIGSVSRADILAYLADELTWGLANAPECYAVLNACRARLYRSDGAIVSKVDGGEAALQRHTGPDDVITRALAQQRGQQPDQPPAPDAIEFVLATARLLRSAT